MNSRLAKLEWRIHLPALKPDVRWNELRPNGLIGGPLHNLFNNKSNISHVTFTMDGQVIEVRRKDSE